MEREVSIVELGQASAATHGMGMWLADDVGKQDVRGLSDS